MIVNAASKDFVCLATCLFAGAGLVLYHGAMRDRLPAWALGSTVLVTAVIFGSPGTDYNHLLDLYAVSLVCLAALGSKPVPGTAWVALCLSVLFVVGAVLNGRNTLRGIKKVQSSRDAILERLVAEGPLGREQLLSQDPMVPLLLGQRPFLMDPFMLRLSRLHDPRITADLWARLRRHDFTAVVLMVDPKSREGIWRLRHRHFGPGFAEVLQENYALEGRYGIYFLYRPRRTSDAPSRSARRANLSESSFLCSLRKSGQAAQFHRADRISTERIE
jgi:hypothetical protein